MLRALGFLEALDCLLMLRGGMAPLRVCRRCQRCLDPAHWTVRADLEGIAAVCCKLGAADNGRLLGGCGGMRFNSRF